MIRFRLPCAVLIASCVLLPATTMFDSTATAQEAAAPAAPSNIQVSPVLADVFGEVLSASPTFADQCERIGRSRYVHVTITPVMAASTTSRGTAHTTMRRFSSGALLASVYIPVPLTTIEYAELFGHELEHILEQIERVDLAAMTLVRDGATRLSDGAYETTRARRTGLAIAIESDRPRSGIVTSPLPQRTHAVVDPPAARQQ
jgi:hypothetical protein